MAGFDGIGKTVKKSAKQQSSYRYLQPFLKAELPLFLRTFLFVLGYVATVPVLPFLAGKASGAIGGGNVEQTAYWLGLAVIDFTFQNVFMYLARVSAIAASQNIALAIREATYANLHRLNVDYFAQSQTGDLTYRLTEDIDKIGEVVTKLSQQFISCILQIIVLTGYIFYLNWQLSVTGLVVAPLMALLISFFGQRQLVLSRRNQTEISGLSSLLTEVFGSIRIVQAFAAQEYEVKRFSERAKLNRDAKYRTEHVTAVQYPVLGFFEALSVMLLFLVGAWQISTGNMAAEEFVTFLTIIAILINPIDLATQQYNLYKQTEASAERVFDLMNLQPTLVEAPDAKPLPAIVGEVDYRNVSFSYRRRLTQRAGRDFGGRGKEHCS